MVVFLKIEFENLFEDEDVIMGLLINEWSVEKIEEVYRDVLEKGVVFLMGFKRKGVYVWFVFLEVSREVLFGFRVF